MSVTEQRKAAKKYIDEKFKELKEKYKSNAELTSRL